MKEMGCKVHLRWFCKKEQLWLLLSFLPSIHRRIILFHSIIHSDYTCFSIGSHWPRKMKSKTWMRVGALFRRKASTDSEQVILIIKTKVIIVEELYSSFIQVSPSSKLSFHATKRTFLLRPKFSLKFFKKNISDFFFG